jgi:hypothetical protein
MAKNFLNQNRNLDFFSGKQTKYQFFWKNLESRTNFWNFEPDNPSLLVSSAKRWKAKYLCPNNKGFKGPTKADYPLKFFCLFFWEKNDGREDAEEWNCTWWWMCTQCNEWSNLFRFQQVFLYKIYEYPIIIIVTNVKFAKNFGYVKLV